MPKVTLCVFAVWLVMVSLTAAGQDTNAAAPAAGNADHTAPSYDMKAQALVDLGQVQKKFVDLANTLPAEKFAWSPSADSRSFARVFLHVAGERYQILHLMGATPPTDFDGKTFEKSTTDKAQIIERLNRSWDWAQMAINDMTNADFSKAVPKLGPQANEGDVVYILVADAHEHLGQLIAYARVNGIVPPWTVAAQKKAAEKAKEKK